MTQTSPGTRTHDQAHVHMIWHIHMRDIRQRWEVLPETQKSPDVSHEPYKQLSKVMLASTGVVHGKGRRGEIAEGNDESFPVLMVIFHQPTDQLPVLSLNNRIAKHHHTDNTISHDCDTQSSEDLSKRSMLQFDSEHKNINTKHRQSRLTAQ